MCESESVCCCVLLCVESVNDTRAVIRVGILDKLKIRFCVSLWIPVSSNATNDSIHPNLFLPLFQPSLSPKGCDNKEAYLLPELKERCRPIQVGVRFLIFCVHFKTSLTDKFYASFFTL